jgi:8-oxo-dGTP diphosphatase
MKKAPEIFRFAAVAVDIVVFTILNGELKVLVSPVNRPPHYKNVDGFLGGMIDAKETAEEACTRVLWEKGGIKNIYTEQLFTFSAVNRDKRNRVISVSYLCLMSQDRAESFKNESACFKSVSDLQNLAYDHDEVMLTAIERLRGKITYSNIAQFLLPKQFTLSELQAVYETVGSKGIDKRNFRKKILALNIIEETGDMQAGMRNRPAALYKFKSQKLEELALVI